MKMRKIMACLDVGSDTIKLVVGEMVKKKLNIENTSSLPKGKGKFGSPMRGDAKKKDIVYIQLIQMLNLEVGRNILILIIGIIQKRNVHWVE